jgi:outer membrane protein assembly factor BamB
MSLMAVLALIAGACGGKQSSVPTPTSDAILTSEVVRCTVFATREGLVGKTTANGHVIEPSDRFAAVPSRSVLASNNGKEFQVRITYKDKSLVVPIWDVGPWNTNDDYWDPPEQRQQWKDLPQCRPQAQAAYQANYNGGQDEFGRQVKNAAGIDLADGTWADLGLRDNDWVVVEFLWTAKGQVVAGGETSSGTVVTPQPSATPGRTSTSAAAQPRASPTATALPNAKSTRAFVPRVMKIPEGWPMWGGNPQRTHAVIEQPSFSPPLQVKWRFATRSWSASSPVAGYGVIYFGSGDGNLYAVDATTGKERWRFKTDGMVLSTPAVADDTVFVGSTSGTFYAIDALKGQLRWKYKTGSWIVSSPLPSMGLIFVGSGDHSVYALNATSGAQVWQFKTSDWVVSSPAINPDGTLFVASWSGVLYALDGLTGRERWRVNLALPIVSTPTVFDGKVFVSILDTRLPWYSAPVARAIGQTIDHLLGASAVFDIGELMTPVVSNLAPGLYYSNLCCGRLYALDIASGEVKWHAHIEGWGVGSLAVYTPPANLSEPVQGTTTSGADSLEDRAMAIEKQFRCPACLEGGMTIFLEGVPLVVGSEALRGVIRKKLAAGESEQDILRYFWKHYGLGIEMPRMPLREKSILLAASKGLYAYTVQDGKRREIADSGWVSSAPVVIGSTLYLIGDGGEIYDLITDARIDGFDVPGAFSTPTYIRGALYVVTQDGQLVAFGETSYRIAKNIKLEPGQAETTTIKAEAQSVLVFYFTSDNRVSVEIVMSRRGTMLQAGCGVKTSRSPAYPLEAGDEISIVFQNNCVDVSAMVDLKVAY